MMPLKFRFYSENEPTGDVNSTVSGLYLGTIAVITIKHVGFLTLSSEFNHGLGYLTLFIVY